MWYFDTVSLQDVGYHSSLEILFVIGNCNAFLKVVYRCLLQFSFLSQIVKNPVCYLKQSCAKERRFHAFLNGIRAKVKKNKLDIHYTTSSFFNITREKKRISIRKDSHRSDLSALPPPKKKAIIRKQVL